MKKVTKRLMAVLLTAMVVAGAQMLTFATVGITSGNESGLSRVASEPLTSRIESSLHESRNESMIAPYGATGNATPNPNTGVPVAPLAVALLAASAVPVIIKTHKK